MKKTTIAQNIIEYNTGIPGPTVAVIAGVHGDEITGVLALRELTKNLKLSRGKLYIVLANPPAIAQNKRQISKNLNRCFYKGNKGQTYEDKRARELMKVMDKCVAVLDLHAFAGEKGEPFVICEENALGIAKNFDVSIISTNWSKTEQGGTDGYMYSLGKVGICVECGPISKAEQYKPFALNTIYQFLDYFGMSSSPTSLGASKTQKKIIRAEYAVVRTSDNFLLQSGFTNFQKLSKGQLVACQDGQNYIAKDNEYIIFPNYKASIGAEAFSIGRDQEFRD